MKTIKKIMALVIFALVMSCGQGKNMNTTTGSSTSQTDSDLSTTSEASRRNSNTSGNTSDNSRYDSNSSSNAQVNNRNSSTINRDMTNSQDQTPSDTYLTQRRQQMYSDLGMTQDQISRYEREHKTVMEKWNRDNNNRSMTASERMRHDGQVLNSVLEPSQYTQYQTWIKNNPYNY